MNESMKARMFKRFMSKVSLIERIIVGLLLAMTILITVANVFSRYVIHQSWSFTEEVVVASFVLMSLIGAALCGRERGGLINLTLFTNKLKTRTQIIIEIIITIMLIGFVGVMFKYGIDRCIAQYMTGRRTATLQIPEWYYNASVPIGAVLIFIHSVERIFYNVLELKELRELERGDSI